jgi:hypothetical protein
VFARLPTMTTLFNVDGFTGSSGDVVAVTSLFCSSTRSLAAIFSASAWSQVIVDAKLLGKLVACTPPVTEPGLVLAPSVLMPCWPSLQ